MAIVFYICSRTIKPLNMKTHFRNLLVIVPIILIIFTTPSCKSKSKIVTPKEKVEVVNKDEAQISLVKNQLRKLLTDSSMSTEELEAELAKIKALNLNDQEISDLTNQVQALISKQKADKAASVANQSLAGNEKAILNTFDTIAKAANYEDANAIILKMVNEFESPSTPVLIIISEENGERDYDRPTTIEKYLDYIKVQKRFELKIEELVRNNTGKISRLILRK
jgi:DNA repair ATPase RecN